MKQRTKLILEELKRLYPDAKCELNYENPLLSASHPRLFLLPFADSGDGGL